MGAKNIHSEPFDKGTITKLEIFEDYAQAWIPTFVMQSVKEIHIFVEKCFKCAKLNTTYNNLILLTTF